jgi:hypothetical protein
MFFGQRDGMWKVLLFLSFGLVLAGCNYSDPKFGPNAGPEVGPVASVLDGDEDADPLAAAIDVSNENAELEEEEPLTYAQEEAVLNNP